MEELSNEKNTNQPNGQNKVITTQQKRETKHLPLQWTDTFWMKAQH